MLNRKALTRAFAGSLLTVFLAVPAFSQDTSDTKVVAGQQADQYYDPVEMAKTRKALKHALGEQKTYMVLFDRLEAQTKKGEDSLVLDGQAWFGGDINKVWLKTEAEMGLGSGDVEDAEVQALWSRAVLPYWDLQVGVRHDFKPDNLDYLVVGFQGLAPYWFEVDVASFLSTDGDLTLRGTVEYDFLLSQRLIFQPRAEVGFSFQDIAERETGSGFSSLSLGARLRYEVKREFAPYIGVEWQRKFGNTADYARAAGQTVGQTSFVAGVRIWF